MKAEFNVVASSEANLWAAAFAVARSFFGDVDGLAVLAQVAYAQENIFIADPNQPVSVNWAATCVTQVYSTDVNLPEGWVFVP